MNLDNIILREVKLADLDDIYEYFKEAETDKIRAIHRSINLHF